MSIHHFVAGIVLVLVGCLAVNAYPDPPNGESTTTDTKAAGTKAADTKAVDKAAETEKLQARIKQLEERLVAERTALQEAKGQRAQLEEQYAGLEHALKTSADTIKQMEERRKAGGPSKEADNPSVNFLKADLEREKAIRQRIQDRIVALTQDTRATADKPPQPRERDDTFTTAVWRFQFYPRQADQPPSERGMMVDTATGRCWALSRRQPRWEDLGGPYEAAAERRAGAGEADPADTLPPPATNKKAAPALNLKPR